MKIRRQFLNLCTKEEYTKIAADSSLIKESLNNIQKGLVALPKEAALMFDSEEGWSIAGGVLSGLMGVLSIFFIQEKEGAQFVEAIIQEEAAL